MTKNKFKIYAFSYGPDDKKWYRQYIQKHADVFIDIKDQNYFESAQKIIDCQIDILVDLNGYTAGNRLPIMAFKPAPVSATYFGYSGTTGTDFIDYLITDHIISPPDQQPYYSEKLVYLPHGLQISSYKELNIPKTPTKKSFNLPENKFVFCCFNNSFKINRKTFATFMAILNSVPDSILWLADNNILAKNNLKNAAKKHKIDLNRLIFAKKTKFEDHLSRIPHADLALDTPYYGGGATTSNALYCGVPVIVLPGIYFQNRIALSDLTQLGLTDELVVKNHREYEKLAIDLATHPKKLKKLKSKLSHLISTSPFFDSIQMTRDLESAYLAMWDRYQKGKKPALIDLSKPSTLDPTNI